MKLTKTRPEHLKLLFPNVDDLVISSRAFKEFEEAVTSMNNIMTELTETMNKELGEEKFGLISEINPAQTGKNTISKQWAENEIAKLWIVDRKKRETDPNMIATGMAQLLELRADPEE
jgi:hypothetical protein